MSTDGQPPADPGHNSYLVAVTDQPRARRAADVTTLLVGLLLVAWGWLTRSHSDGVATALAEASSQLPGWVDTLLSMIYTLAVFYALAVVVLLVANRRWSALRDMVLATLAAIVVALAVIAGDNALWPAVLPEIQEPGPPQFPVLRVAVVTAILVATTPFLARPFRRLGWIVVLLVSGAAIALAYGAPAGVFAALGLGMACGAAVLLGFGSPQGYPDVTVVRRALAELDVNCDDLAVAHDQSWGVRRLVGRGAEVGTIEVKAYGRDAADAQFAARALRSVLYRGGGQRVPLSRVQAVEHEALVTIMAERAGVEVPRVLAAARADDEVALLVTTRQGRRLDEGASVSDDALVSLWQDVARLHDAGITHGSLNGQAVRVGPDGHTITDFGSGSLVASESGGHLDVARLLFATAASVGTPRAVAAAQEGLGTDRLSGALGYLQTPALGKTDRAGVKKPGALMKELRATVAEATGATPPEPVKLRRLGMRQILMLVLIMLFLSALIPLLAGIDYATLWAELQTANWWLVGAAIVVGQLAFLPQAVSMMFAVGRSIPLRPMVILQPAITFISFAVPGMAGRVTMEGAFLYRYGVSPAASVTKGSIDAFAGFLVQSVLLLIAILTGALVLVPSSSADQSQSSWSWWTLLAVVGLAVATVVAVWRVPALNRRIVPQIRKGWDALAEVLTSPSRAIGLLGANLVVQVLWGFAMWLALEALGAPQSLLTCTAVVVGTSLLQGLVPVPGGIGVSEAVIAALLAPLGVTADISLAAAAIWRVATFYLPAAEGFFAARWLQRSGHL